MKNTRTMLIAFIVMIATAISAQSPQSFNYQTVVRTNSDVVVPNQNVSFRFTIHDGSAGGSPVYSETQSLTTNVLGLVTCAIGAGTPVSGTFAGIAWGGGPKYLEVEIDATGGNNYTSMGASQLLSVPYALYAANGGGVSTGSANGTTNYVSRFTTDSTLGNSNIFTNDTNVGINVSSPAFQLCVSNSTGSLESSIQLTTPTAGFTSQDGARFRLFNSTDLDIYNFESGPISFFTSAFPRFTITHNGNIGIGTTSPVSLLDVQSGGGGAAPQIRAYNTANDFARFRLQDVKGGSKYWDIAGYVDSTNDANSALNLFHSSWGNAVTITGRGIVAINQTVDTSYRLNVGGVTINGANIAGTVIGLSAQSSANGLASNGPSAGIMGNATGTANTAGVFGESVSNGCTNCTAITGYAANGNTAVRALTNNTASTALEVSGIVKVSGANKFVFQVTTPATNPGQQIYLPTTIANASTDLVFVQPIWTSSNFSYSFTTYWWTNSSQWAIITSDGSNLQPNQTFNVMVIKQ